MLDNLAPKSSVLENPEVLPLYSVHAIAKSPILVVAPHPDDECLGCGGAIALLRELGCSVHILVMSDGTMSHPNSRQYPAAALKSLRAAETQSAMAILGVNADHITFLGLADSAVPLPNSLGFSAAVLACQNCLEAIAPQIIFLPWRQDPHIDHRATWQILQSALKHTALKHTALKHTALKHTAQHCDSSNLSVPHIIEYPIWDWDLAQRSNELNHEVTKAWRLDIQTVLVLKQKAIATYRSQVTDLINDDPQGFRLSASMLAHFAHPWEVYLDSSEK